MKSKLNSNIDDHPSKKISCLINEHKGKKSIMSII